MVYRIVTASFALVLAVGPASPVCAEVKLAYKHSEGTSLRSTVTMKVHQILTLAGMEIESTVDNTVVTSESVGARNADGTLPVTESVESLRAAMDLPGGIAVRFDSAEPDVKIDNPQVAFLGDIFKLLVGSSHTLILDDQGKVKFVQGTEMTLGKLEGLDPKVSGVVKKTLQSESIQRKFEQTQSSLPETAVKPGDSWERVEDAELGAGQTLTFKKRYEYVGPVEEGGKTLDKIDVKALEVTYKMDPDADSPLEHLGSDLKIDSSHGTILFDRDHGRAVKSSGTTRIKGNMTFKVNNMELPSKLDLTFENSTATELATKPSQALAPPGS
jgi:hypothetical protein